MCVRRQPQPLAGPAGQLPRAESAAASSRRPSPSSTTWSSAAAARRRSRRPCPRASARRPRTGASPGPPRPRVAARSSASASRTVGGVRGQQVGEPARPRPPAAAPTRSRRSARASSASRRTAWSPNTASSTFCDSRVVPPATPTSAPVGMNAVLANTAIMTTRPVAFTPYAAIRAVVRRAAPSRRTRSSTSPCQSRTVRSMASRRFGDERSSRASVTCRSRAAPAGAGPPRGRRPLRRPSAAASTSSARRPTPAPRCSSVAGGGRPVIAAPSRSRSRPTRACSVRSSSPVPTNSCQRASTSPRSSEPSRIPVVDVGDRARVGRVGVRPQPLRGVDLRPRPARRARRSAAGGCRARRRGCGGRPRRGARRRAARSENQPRSGATTGSGSRPSCQRRLGDDEQRRAAQAVRGEHLLQVRGDVVLGARRHPVEHDGERGAAFLRGLQELPRHRVGVAGRGGDEQPEVGGGEQLGREPAVGGDHGVDVGGVEEGQPGVAATAR